MSTYGNMKVHSGWLVSRHRKLKKLWNYCIHKKLGWHSPFHWFYSTTAVSSSHCNCTWHLGLPYQSPLEENGVIPAGHQYPDQCYSYCYKTSLYKDNFSSTTMVHQHILSFIARTQIIKKLFPILEGTSYLSYRNELLEESMWTYKVGWRK
ncbi:hypothetical protein Pmani_031053 [Petrolisthes manimaculis]|uniref:Uncharacterized protein n=1 Tax=Petrolisthes manimaculis TaxID=1843537 RepID=A0AAE1NUE7_9EUCA|nr:hypothetical protein Pmani_031053 [Petrolisthes manimaculis]